MALFPEASFRVLVAPPGVMPGRRVDATLELTVPQEVPRAQRLEWTFKSTVKVSYGSGEDQTTGSAELFTMPFGVTFASRSLGAGKYSYPFSFDCPPFLPPAIAASDFSIEHRIEVRLDVDWALDPTKDFTPTVTLAPVEATTEPLMMRSPDGWHSSLVLDVTLDRRAIAVGEAVTGEIAMRGGREARFDRLEVTLQSQATIVMGKRERRRFGNASHAHIPAGMLREGEPVRFTLPYPKGSPPTFKTGFIDHDMVLSVQAIAPWRDAGFQTSVLGLPAGSKVALVNDGRVVKVGTDRLRNLAAAMAQATGLSTAQLPVLVEGKVGPVRVRMTDGPRAGRVGLDIDFGLPDLDLGIDFRRLGTLDWLQKSPLLPPALSEYYLRVASGRSAAGALAVPVPDGALAEFLGVLFEGLESRHEPRLTDHHFGFHRTVRSDNLNDMLDYARWTKSRAEAISAAIERMPFAPIHPDARAAWTATAREQHGYLLPHIPALHGLVVAARTLGGDVRELGARLRTKHDRTISADLDLGRAAIPLGAMAELEDYTSQLLAPVRAAFPRVRVHSTEKVTLEGAAFAVDPRPLLSVLDVFLDWLLDARGEKRTQHAYR